MLTSATSSSPDLAASSALAPDWLALVQLIVDDGRVTQIERTEETRLPTSHDSSGF